MNLTPNQWRKASLIFFSISLGMLLTSCAALPAWITEAQQILPVAISIVSGLLGIISALNGKTITAGVLNTITAVETKVQNGLAELETLIKAYNANPGTTILTDIEAGANDVVANLQSLFSVAGISDAATQAKITAVAQLVITELQAWMSILPVLKAPALTHQSVTVPFTAKEFRAAYNTILDTVTGNPAVDAACIGAKHL